MPQARHVPIPMPVLSGGKSDQPPNLRFANQVKDAKNVVFSLVDGCSKRPGSQFVSDVSALLPDAAGSADSQSTAPTISGTAPATCVHATWASSYTLAYDITGTDPDGVAISHTGQSATIAQHTALCQWSVQGTARSTLTPWIFMNLDTFNKLWTITFLMRAAAAAPIALYGTSTRDDALPVGAYGDTGDFGDSTRTYELDIKNVSIT